MKLQNWVQQRATKVIKGDWNISLIWLGELGLLSLER